MKFNPDIHHRRSLRLKHYDYSQSGAYFVTICTHHRECLFGEIVDGKMQLNDAGRMAEKWLKELENKYPHITCCPFICMPNHVHLIVAIHSNQPPPVGADQIASNHSPLVGADRIASNHSPLVGADRIASNHSPLVGADLCVCPKCVCPENINSNQGAPSNQGAHIGAPLRQLKN
jgi:REP element-mobilizing transposase RayT